MVSRTVRGVRTPIPAGYVVGRPVGGGDGAAQLISITDLANQVAASGGLPPGGGSFTVAAGTGISVAFSGGTYTVTNSRLTLASLNDVLISSPSSGQFLKYNGSAWINSTVSLTTTLAALTDVALGSLATRDLLYYDAGTGKWKNFPAGRFPKVLGTDGNVLKWQYTGASPWHQVVGPATTVALPACTYNNGTSGIGATLTGNANGALAAIDGITMTVGGTLIVKNQVAALQNGPYTVTQLGDGSHPFILTRTPDADQGESDPDGTNWSTGHVWCVTQGTVNASSGPTFWALIPGSTPSSVGTTTYTFKQVAGANVATVSAGSVSFAIAAAANNDVLRYNSSNSDWENESLSALLDSIIGSARGTIITRGASLWSSLAPGAAGTFLQSQGSGADLIYSSASGGAPQRTVLTSGSGTYTTPTVSSALPLYLEVEWVGGGGGGGGSGTPGATAGGNGGDTTFGTSLLSGTGGAGGAATGTTTPSTGGTATGGDLNEGGAAGTPSDALGIANENGGDGGQSFFGGRGPGGSRDSTTGFAANNRSGSGGGGGIGGSGFSPGVGGAAGAYGRKIIVTPAASYAYVVGAGGTAGGAGTGGAAGGAGGGGVIIATAYFAGGPVGGTHYDVAFSVPGVPAASQSMEHTFSKAVTIPANFGAFLGRTSQAGGTVTATASTVFTVKKALAAAPTTFSTTVGTITFALGTVTPTFATTGGAAQTFAQGDTIQVVAPASPDATFAGFRTSLCGFET